MAVILASFSSCRERLGAGVSGRGQIRIGPGHLRAAVPVSALSAWRTRKTVGCANAAAALVAMTAMKTADSQQTTCHRFSLWAAVERTAIRNNTAPAASAYAAGAQLRRRGAGENAKREDNGQRRNDRPEGHHEARRIHARGESRVTKPQRRGAREQIDNEPADRAGRASAANCPDSASVSATPAVTRIAFTGVRKRGMHAAKERRQIALLGERKQVARARQRLAHVVARGREHGAERDQRRARPIR